MNQTDKNIAIAEACGASILQNLADITVVQLMSNELDEYTSRVCAESQTLANERAVTVVQQRHDIDCAAMREQYLERKLAEKDALIAMQADAVCQSMRWIDRTDTDGHDDYDKCEKALSATTETVEAWKNKLVNEEVAKARVEFVDDWRGR